MASSSSPVFQIGDRKVASNLPPVVIVEIGINHGGDLGVAKEMVRAAVSSGAEIVKHQTHIAAEEMTEEAKTVYPANAGGQSIWEVIDENSLSLDEEVELKAYTESLGAIYISTPFSRAAADFLYEIGVPAFKIGSGETDNIPLLRHIAAFGKPMIVSTGMRSIEELIEPVRILDESGAPYALLECTNAYPTLPEHVSLQGIAELRDAFPNAVIGFSDHTMGPFMSIASVALGASIIERHFTDTRYREGPDIICSMDPAELRLLVDRTKEVHAAMQKPKGRAPSEKKTYEFARASIVAAHALSAGQVLTEADIWAKRPGTGEIAGYDFDKLIGKACKVDIPQDKLIEWKEIGD
ncbi:MAG: polyhydroxyalkanoate biosynthesis repressor PhaR [Alphaproteobacteria bacterium]|nr:polyhydroxyalkanoate biosynthesis repressor PhaR [Alphaproteobacteria bacterium]